MLFIYIAFLCHLNIQLQLNEPMFACILNLSSSELKLVNLQTCSSNVLYLPRIMYAKYLSGNIIRNMEVFYTYVDNVQIYSSQINHTKYWRREFPCFSCIINKYFCTALDCITSILNSKINNMHCIKEALFVLCFHGLQPFSKGKLQ